MIGRILRRTETNRPCEECVGPFIKISDIAMGTLRFYEICDKGIL